MRRGEITGQSFDLSKADMGMPVRSTYIMKKKEMANSSNIDNLLSLFENNDIDENNFTYFDPHASSYAPDIKNEIDNDNIFNDNDRISLDIQQRYNTLPVIDRIPSSSINHITNQQSEYLNIISCNIFNSIANKTIINFCISPIAILSKIIKNDPNINRIMSLLNYNEIFHKTKFDNNTIISKATIFFMNNIQKLKFNFTHYEDYMNNIVEFPFLNKTFAFGFICNKSGSIPSLSHKDLNGYIINLKHSKKNIYCPSFKISNKINMNSTFLNLGYIQNNNLNYLQTIYLNFMNNIYIQNTTLNDTIDLSENFIFYIRHVPNNILLFLGRHGSI
jgi:hypothetical protein